MNPTKAQVKKKLRIESDVALADILGCTPAAAGLWPSDAPLGELWLWKLHGLYPSQFKKPKPVKRVCKRRP